MNIRIGNYVYLVVESFYYPGYAISHKCGKVKQGIDGEYIEWYT